MRSILIIILFVVYIIVMLPALLIFHLIGKKNIRKAERAVHACISWLFRTTRFIAGSEITVEGLENVPDDRPVLFIGNHNSYFDIIYTYPLCQRTTSYVAKADILKVPLFPVWGKLMMTRAPMRLSAKLPESRIPAKSA